MLQSSYLSGELLQKFKYQLSDALESTVRSRRDTGTTDQYEIDIIEGTPRYTNSNEDEVLIVFLVKDGKLSVCWLDPLFQSVRLRRWQCKRN